MEYLLKASLVIVIFYSCYKLFLQRDTFFESNRWFLLTGLITATVLPFVVIPIYVEYTPTPIESLIYNSPITSVEAPENPITVWHYILGIYIIGAIIFTFRFCIQLTSLLSLIVKSKKYKQQSYTFVEATNNILPFSFFRWVVYNPNKFNKEELQHIISHEKVHVNQYHTLDIIISQLTAIAFWFNPVIWFYKKDLQQNLEFIADNKAQNNTNNKKSYQELLLKTSVPNFKMALTNNFYSSLIKKRIVMLHKSKSKKRNLFKHALVLPFLALFLMGFNTKEVYIAKVPENSEVNQKIADTYIITKQTTDAELKSIASEIIKNGGTFSYVHQRNSDNEIVNLEFEIKNHGTGNYNSEAPFKEVYFGTLVGGGIFIAEDEENYKNMLNRKNSNIQILTPKKQTQTQSRNNTKQIVSQNPIAPFSVTITKDFADDDLEKVIKKAKKHGLILKFSKVIRNSNDEIINITSEIKVGDSKTVLTYNDGPIKPFTCYRNQKDFGFGKPEDSSNKTNSYSYVIKADTLLFHQGDKTISADTIYFNKHNISFNEPIQFNTKENIATTASNGVFFLSPGGSNPIYIVDGKEVSKKQIESMTPYKVHSISVLRDDNATALYGKKAKDGAILISTKKNWETKFVVGKAFNSKDNQEGFSVSGKVTNEEGLGLPGANILVKGTSSGATSDFKGNYSIRVSADEILVFSDIGCITKSITVKDENTINVTLKNDPTKKEVKKALLIIDGKEEKNKTVEDLDVNTIESVTILKDKNDTKKYGKKGEKGVVEITTKKD
ncbi:M56 family metallopeptidase [Aestuariivivens insulae]|uniref:M56 family metallopeptidase n=1 Tax=Aestuariivivens insulae TaxID=1621988 RepID=UPI001F59CD62|nr:M56 family metallopeptidase [Aestuariivivens insulae]